MSSTSSPNKPLRFAVPWNCAGLRPRLGELALILERKPITILALTDPGLPNNWSISVYKAYRNMPFTSFLNDSAALLIRSDFRHYELNVLDLCNTHLEVTAANIAIPCLELRVVSVYVSFDSPATKSVDLVPALVDRFPESVVLCGNFSVHHHFWEKK